MGNTEDVGASNVLAAIPVRHRSLDGHQIDNERYQEYNGATGKIGVVACFILKQCRASLLHKRFSSADKYIENGITNNPFDGGYDVNLVCSIIYSRDCRVS